MQNVLSVSWLLNRPSTLSLLNLSVFFYIFWINQGTTLSPTKYLDEEEDVVDIYEDEEEEDDVPYVAVATNTAGSVGSGGGTARRSKFARGREHWHRDQIQQQQQLAGGSDHQLIKEPQLPGGSDHQLLKEQQLRSGSGGGGEQQRVSQDDSGIGVGTSLEVLAGLAATTPSPTLPQEGRGSCPGTGRQQEREEEEKEGGGATLTSGPIS